MDDTLTRVIFQLYDDDMNPYFPPRRMGIALIPFDDSLQPGKVQERWLDLQPNLEGDNVTGAVKVRSFFRRDILIFVYNECKSYDS